LSEKSESRTFIKRSEVVGKQVVEKRGYVIGTVKDLSFTITPEGVELAISVDSAGRELNIPWAEVQAIGDVVLLKSQYEKPASAPALVAPPAVPTPTPITPGLEKICPYCEFKNPPDAKFCVRCGRRLPG